MPDSVSTSASTSAAACPATPTPTRELGAAIAAHLAAGTPTDLADTLADMQDLLVGVHSGLIANAPTGQRIHPAADMAFSLAGEVIARALRCLADGELWADEAVAGEYATADSDTRYLMTDADLGRLEMRAAVLGAEYATSLAAVA